MEIPALRCAPAGMTERGTPALPPNLNALILTPSSHPPLLSHPGPRPGIKAHSLRMEIPALRCAPAGMTERGTPALPPILTPLILTSLILRSRPRLGLRLEGRGRRWPRWFILLESLVLRDAMRSRIAPQDEGGWAMAGRGPTPEAPPPQCLSSRHPLGCGAWLEKSCEPQWKGGAERPGLPIPPLAREMGNKSSASGPGCPAVPRTVLEACFA